MNPLDPNDRDESDINKSIIQSESGDVPEEVRKLNEKLVHKISPDPQHLSNFIATLVHYLYHLTEGEMNMQGEIQVDGENVDFVFGFQKRD